MIIKCPKCKNVFLAPDDLQEGQTLKCGKCNNQWQLKQAINEIPESIKPNEEDSTFPLSSKRTHPILKNIASIIFIILLICIVCFSLRKEIIQIWQPASYVFESVGVNVTVPISALEFENLSSEVIDNITYISGSIVNNSEEALNVPLVHIGEELSVQADDSYLKSGDFTKFRAILNDSSKKEINIYF